MIIEFQTNNRKYKLSELSLSGIIDLATYLKINKLNENRAINTGYEIIDHTYNEIQQVASVGFNVYKDKYEEENRR